MFLLLAEELRYVGIRTVFIYILNYNLGVECSIDN